MIWVEPQEYHVLSAMAKNGEWLFLETWDENYFSTSELSYNFVFH